MSEQMMTKVKSVVFDLDGTLVDAFDAVARSLNHALAAFDLPSVADDVIKRSVGWGEGILIRKFVSEDIAEKVLEVYRAHHKEALRETTIFLPGTEDVLRRLHKDGIRLAIATNRPSVYTHIILDYLQIADLFDCVLCADEISQPKPDPEILDTIRGRLALNAEEMLYVGDMPLDVVTGCRAGIRTIAVLTGTCTTMDFKDVRPFKMICQLDEIFEDC